MVAMAYNIPLRFTSLCEQPLVPLRGLVNSSFWRIHPLYIRHIKNDCDAAAAFSNADSFAYDMTYFENRLKRSSSSSNGRNSRGESQSQIVETDRKGSSKATTVSVSEIKRKRDSHERNQGKHRDEERAEAEAVSGEEKRREKKGAHHHHHHSNGNTEGSHKRGHPRKADLELPADGNTPEGRRLSTSKSANVRKRDKEKEEIKSVTDEQGLATLKCCNPLWLELMHARVAPVHSMNLERGWDEDSSSKG